ncbi:hypothetical protein CSPX01_06344 [Colletotrichum filicis]|nr:hypothetical protein CSPX01_06344 [Colletotrichum filicis]
MRITPTSTDTSRPTTARLLRCHAGNLFPITRGTSSATRIAVVAWF